MPIVVTAVWHRTAPERCILLGESVRTKCYMLVVTIHEDSKAVDSDIEALMDDIAYLVYSSKYEGMGAAVVGHPETDCYCKDPDPTP